MEARDLKTDFHELEATYITTNTSKIYHIIKRLFDIVFSIMALVISSLLLLVVAIMIKLEDGGRIIYKQTRVCKEGRLFELYKLRSMRENTDKLQETLQKKVDPNNPFYKIRNDPRITKIGNFIRKTSIDEIPQFVNILKGDMSIVGPRPLQPNEASDYPDYLRLRSSVRPGLTCYWQVSGRSKVECSDRMRLDLMYIEDCGFITDGKIMIKTVPAVLNGKGAA